MDSKTILKAFNELYADLGSDLDKLLTSSNLFKDDGQFVKKLGRRIGIKWRLKDAKGKFVSEFLLLEIDRTDLSTVLGIDSIHVHQEPYESKANPSKCYLLNTDWRSTADDDDKNKVVRDFINSFGKTYIPLTYLEKVPGALSSADTQPLNLILYGPPGTGKTYHTVNKALEILDPSTDWTTKARKDAITAFTDFRDVKKQIVFTTFHQSMSYEDFIEGIKPDLSGKSLGYEIKSGVFKQISQDAFDNPGKNYVLIIDEINRGNVANIFGELITLIEEDKRKGCPEAISVILPYSKTPFFVPKNLYIIGTMNTADRSVEALDSALRRRFTFIEMMPQPNLLGNVEIDGFEKKTLKDLLDIINKRIEVIKDREHQIGHSYFMRFADQSSVKPDELKNVFTKKIIPLLQEYFYGDYEKIQLVVGEGFVKQVNDKVIFAGGKAYEDAPEKMFTIENEPNMEDALEKLLNK